jgi:hypothetical protein
MTVQYKQLALEGVNKQLLAISEQLKVFLSALLHCITSSGHVQLTSVNFPQENCQHR